jgi:hypothetical protein
MMCPRNMDRKRTISPLLWIGILLVLTLALWPTLLLRRAWLGGALACLGALLPYLYAAWSFYRMIPRTVVLRPIPEEEACPKLRALVAELGSVGFRPVVGPLHYNSRPRSQLSLLIHEEETVYAAVLRVRVFLLTKVHFSFLTPFADAEGHLESTATPELDAVRAPESARLQVFPWASPADLLEHHRYALARMRRAGRRLQAPAASDLQREAIYSLAATGQYLRQNAYRLALGVFIYAWNRKPRNPPPFQEMSEAAPHGAGAGD